METLQIGVLGPVEAYLGGRRVCLNRSKEGMVLALLTVALNQAVSTDSLLEGVWDGDPPRSGLDTLQSIVSRLRQRLGGHAIETTHHAYRLNADPDQVDAVRFEHMLGHASSLLADDPPAAGALAIEALALWRGTPFGDLSNADALESEVQRLETLRLSALEVRLEADVVSGRPATAIAELRGQIAENPYRERLWYLLILGLARDGRRVDALRACHGLRRDLAEIGLEPTADIRELEQMVLDEAPAVRPHLHR